MIHTRSFITVYAMFSVVSCPPGWCAVDTGFWHGGHATYYNHLGQPRVPPFPPAAYYSAIR